ncbi:uncharacterized protein UMAG_05431 [Mycosarcoma maydis]|uniref:Uncharacterized protein n=1 Tax=Mycosarcoma maydis TaxID=5270 RepID=A0A0D1BWU3_MYCMD|nr:uncharacterized protein UMAG_05431 [Ustilago maydis 521]KIS66437.1 hypothetical protein UMAG_05431 [Ustilago maydis 521]|eukprot:XP_011392116.1 hypothetical protein UMAG_05431 [Ustilago maydis 521]
MSTSSSFASTAFNLYTTQQQIEQCRPRLSRMSFVGDCFRVSGSVLPRIFPSVLCLTIYATAIALADLVWQQQWNTSYSVTSSLSVVVGLLLVFRNSTSYDRWYEGRKLWQDATTTARTLALLIWINVDAEREAEKRQARIASKKRTLRLLTAFMVAVKHELRAEPGTAWADFKGVLPNEWIRASAIDANADGASASANAKTSSSRTNTAMDVEQGAGLTTSSETQPLLLDAEHSVDDALPVSQRILAELHGYLASTRRAGLLDDAGPAGFSLLNTQLVALSTLASSMQRISTTPTPLIYAIHLKQSCFIYLLALPLALVGELRWKMVPFVSVFSMMLIGLEGISSEIEDPFGEDKSDHPLDLWCSKLRWQIELIIQSVVPAVDQE